MRNLLKLLIGCALLSPVTPAQTPTGACAPVTNLNGFTNNTSITGCELNIVAANALNTDAYGNQIATDGTANSLATPTAQDNTASVSPGDPIIITLSNTAGAAGQLVGIYYTPVPAFSIPLSGAYAGLGTLYLNTATSFGVVVDGMGFVTGVPNPFFSHPGPGYQFSLTVALAAIPGINNTCAMVQAAIQDPTTFSGLRMSNAVSLEIRTALRAVNPDFGPVGTLTTVTAPGTTSGTLSFPAFPFGPPAPTVYNATSANLSFLVPAGATSGALSLTPAGAPNASSVADPDSMTQFFAVTAPTITALANTGSALTTVPAGGPPTGGIVSVTNTLANGLATHLYTINLNAGDGVIVEAYALNAAGNHLLDGYGKTLNPAATAGCDLQLELFENTNQLPLTFDQGATGPFLIAANDDGGPELNPVIAFQVRATDTYQIRVSCADPAAFAGGRYLLNVRTLTTLPSVEAFRSGATTVNVATPGSTISIIGHNFPVGGTCSVDLKPAHGIYGSYHLSGITPVSATQLDVVLPSFALYSFGTGVHTVGVNNDANGYGGAVWDTSTSPGGNVVNGGGIAPDRLFIRSATVTAPTVGGSGITAATTNTQTYGLQTLNATPASSTFSFQVQAYQTIYIEVLGVKYNTTLPFSLVDSGIETGGTLGIYNPYVTLLAPTVFTLLADNDDDGQFPTYFSWPGPGGTPGIGRNAAILFTDPGIATGVAPFLATVSQITQVGTAAQSKGYFINIIVL